MRRINLGALVGLCLVVWAGQAFAQTRILPLGDSITNGGNGYVSYRYELWFALDDAGYDVEFVGRNTGLNGGSTPNAAWYPDYFTDFDRDHEGYWGWRTDEIAGIAIAAATATLPDIVLLHLGTNDIGQQGAAGVTNADGNLRLIIDRLRSVRPNVTILLAQIIDIGPGNGYSLNANQVAPLNGVIATIAADMNTAQSPVLLIDQNTGFDTVTMLQGDGLHPNLLGEAQMSGVWEAALSGLLPAGNPAPTIAITSPADGASFVDPASVPITVDASDSNGSVVEVRFFAGASPIGSSTEAPFSFDWVNPPLGNFTLTAEAEDDQGRSAVSDPVSVTLSSPGVAVPVFVTNPSFEVPVLGDIQLASGPGNVGGWEFAATANTFLGIFNPPAGSYSTAGGNGTATGADGINAAFLFNDGGPAESVEATQLLGEVLLADTQYTLTVAIGRFLPDQPYSFSTYGGYTIELLAGQTVIASDTDGVNPAVDTFADASASVFSGTVDPVLLGQPLSIRLGISINENDRSTHFDNVRLTRTTGVTSSPSPRVAAELDLHPNPFNPRTTVKLKLSQETTADLAVFDVAGRRVIDLFRAKELEAGTHRWPLELPAPTGVYFLRLSSPEGVVTRKITLLK